MQFDYASGRLSSDCADEIIGNTKARGLTREWIIETHVHADHLSGALYILQELGGKIGIGEHIHEVQDTLGKVFNEEIEFERCGSQFDPLLADADTYRVGDMACFALHAPEPTLDCMVHVMGDTPFAGDRLFMPNAVSARPFPRR